MSVTDEVIFCRGLTKTYPGAAEVTALDDVTLAIHDNEFFTLLGPSGCGKTTLLRLIAGFEVATAGEIRLFGRDIGDAAPEDRPVNTVFQTYALFPHMSVIQNVRFGLERKGAKRATATDRAREMLEMVRLSEFADRMPSQLSGGQQQRVALARALAPDPKVLLLDEPLSALDLKLRQSMREELKRLQRETGITFIFVTHDQEEALAMSDRIAVLSGGCLRQVGTPSEIYERPASRFVAEFIGDANFLAARCETVRGPDAVYRLSDDARLLGPTGAVAGASVTLAIRPERLRIAGEAGGNRLAGQVDEVTFLGDRFDCRLTLPGGQHLTLRLAAGGTQPPARGERIVVELPRDALRVVEAA